MPLLRPKVCVQADRNHGVSDIPAWSNEGRVDKPAWQDEKPRENHRWDKPGGGAFSERPKSYPGVEEPPRGALHSGGGAMGGKWREDSDRVPVRRDLPRCTSSSSHAVSSGRIGDQGNAYTNYLWLKCCYCIASAFLANENAFRVG